MRLGDYDFAEACQIDAVRNPDGTVATYTAYERFANPRDLSLNPYGLGPFVRLRLSNRLSTVPGVYAVVRHGDVLYVGRTQNLAERWGRRNYAVIDPRNCYTGGQSTNCRINNLLGSELIDGGALALWVYETTDIETVETAVFRAIRPSWNVREL